MSPGAPIPPSIGNCRNINTERMEIWYTCIASSISDLARQQFFRGVNVINNDVIATIQALWDYNLYYGEIVLLRAYDQKIEILQQERRQSQLLGQRMFAGLSNDLPRSEIDDHVNITDGTEKNINTDTTDLETESEPQRNIHRCSYPD